MGIGASIFLIAIGAVLAFAINVEDAGVFNINTIGWILMGAGILGAILTLTVFGSRRRSVDGGVTREREVVRDRDRDVY